MKTEDIYRDVVNQCIVGTGKADEEWNKRFRQRLDACGLALSSMPPGYFQRNFPDGYPDGTPYRAPAPYEGPDGWSEEAVIVWVDDH